MSAAHVAIVGCGSAGPALATLLARAGHQVTVFERTPALTAVGAGILLEANGQAALRTLGVWPAVAACGQRIRRLHGATAGGRTVLDLCYADAHAHVSGFGIHRAALLNALVDGMHAAGARLQLGTEIVALERRADGQWLRAHDGAEYGPFALVVIADGTQSRLTAAAGLAPTVRQYPWGAVWLIGPTPAGLADDCLAQRYRGTTRMVGVLPTGRVRAGVGEHLTSMFWSLRLAEIEAWRAAGVSAWRADVARVMPAALPLVACVDDLSALTVARYANVRVARVWRDGVVVLGDAAHAMSPQLGMGANLGLADAVTLAAALAEHADQERALAAYARQRQPVWRFYQAASRLLTPVFQSRLRPLAWPRDAFGGMVGRIPALRRLSLDVLLGLKTGWCSVDRGLLAAAAETPE